MEEGRMRTAEEPSTTMLEEGEDMSTPESEEAAEKGTNVLSDDDEALAAG
jgi:hypothetical protein